MTRAGPDREAGPRWLRLARYERRRESRVGLRCDSGLAEVDGMADVRLTALETELLHPFQPAECGPPRWAYQFPPSIPLVGAGYVPDRSLMVDASAENLTWMERNKKRTSPRWESFCEDTAVVRYWHQYHTTAPCRRASCSLTWALPRSTMVGCSAPLGSSYIIATARLLHRRPNC